MWLFRLFICTVQDSVSTDLFCQAAIGRWCTKHDELEPTAQFHWHYWDNTEGPLPVPSGFLFIPLRPSLPTLSTLSGSWQIGTAIPILLYPHPEGLRGEGCSVCVRKSLTSNEEKYGFKLAAIQMEYKSEKPDVQDRSSKCVIQFPRRERCIWLGDFYYLCLIFHITPQCTSNEKFFFASSRASRVFHHIPTQRPWKELMCTTFVWLGEKKKNFCASEGLSFNLEIVVKMENNTEQKQLRQLKDHHSKSLGKGSL